jgi:transposase-like protein/IS1 family transposase
MARLGGLKESPMQCQACQTPAKRFGKDRRGNQRFRCRTCRKTFSERPERPLGAMRLPIERAELILHLLTEGNAVRAIERVTGTEKKTILRLLVQVGAGCERLLAERVKDVPVQDVQSDEVWGYVRCKEGTKKRRGITDPEAGDAYCWIGLERHSKLVLAWHLGRRTKWDAHDFMEKLSAATTADRFQLTSDGFNAYPDAVEYNFGARVDYAQLVKEFGAEGGDEQRRYAPPRLIGAEKITVSGAPDEDRICTSHVERAANLRAALALFFAYYNFCRMHKSIRMTPAMKAGLTRRPWSVGDLLREASMVKY